MAVNVNIVPTIFTDITQDKIIKNISIVELSNALNKLDTLKVNVQNCNCSPSNCCQSCQSCQACQACQTQVNCSCQSQCNCNCSCSEGGSH